MAGKKFKEALSKLDHEKLAPVQGLVIRARGGLELSVAWRGGRPVSATLKAAYDGTRRIRSPRGTRITEARAGAARLPLKVGTDGITDVTLKAGQSCQLSFA